MTKKNTAVYIRTSTSKQEKGHQSQLYGVKKYCQKSGIKNYKIYEDFGISGAKQSRPGLDKLLSDCEKEKLDHIIVYSFSRVARSLRQLLEILDLIQSHDVKFTSITENIDWSTSYSRAIYSILGAIANLERDILIERTKQGLESARAKGKTLGRPRTRNSKLIRELNSKGYSQRRIAALVGCSKTTVYRELKGGP